MKLDLRLMIAEMTLRLQRPWLPTNEAVGAILQQLYDRVFPKYPWQAEDVTVLRGGTLAESGLSIGLFRGLGRLELRPHLFSLKINEIRGQADLDVARECFVLCETMISEVMPQFMDAAAVVRLDSWVRASGADSHTVDVLTDLALPRRPYDALRLGVDKVRYAHSARMSMSVPNIEFRMLVDESDDPEADFYIAFTVRAGEGAKRLAARPVSRIVEDTFRECLVQLGLNEPPEEGEVAHASL